MIIWTGLYMLPPFQIVGAGDKLKTKLVISVDARPCPFSVYNPDQACRELASRLIFDQFWFGVVLSSTQ